MDFFEKEYHHFEIRVLYHIAFLTASYLLLLRIFSFNEEVHLVDHVYTAIFLGTLLPPVYLNLEWLLPGFGSKRKWLAYGLVLLALIVLFSWLNLKFFNDWSATLLPTFYFISYFTWWEVAGFFVAFVAITTLLKLSRSWFRLNELQQRFLVLEKERVDMELAALKAQVNPHFFFNTLNSIYAMSLDQDQRLPSTVLQLSGIMRYYLYESQGEKVPLEQEMNILKNYMELQRIRSTEKLDIRFDSDENWEDTSIAPLLLLTLAENAFKHGTQGASGLSFIHIKAELLNGEFSFQISNSKGKSDGLPEKEKGLGLANLKRRLELLYPGTHELRISETEDNFTVSLKLKLR